MSLPEIPPFVPHPLIRGGHAQTIAGVYLPNRQSAYGAKLRLIDLEDGDQIALHDDRPPNWQRGDRIALLVHGLGGCHGSPYMVRIAEKLTARGVRVFRKDLRGWGAGAKIAKLPFHAARSEDIVQAVNAINKLSPTSKIALVGFSLGANIVLRMLGTVGTGCQRVPEVGLSSAGEVDRASATGWQPVATTTLDRAMAIAPPIDLMDCCVNLSRGFKRTYDRHYAKFLWRHLQSRTGIVPEFATAAKQARPRRIYEFDERFTAPLGGFDSVEHYYETASSKPVLRNIEVPTVILSADDDPIVPGHVFNDAKLSPHVTLHLTEHGGHMGYVAARNGEADRRWMDWRVVDFVTS